MAGRTAEVYGGWHTIVRAMERRRIAWLLSLALMAVGGVLAHVLAYSLVVPGDGARGQMLAHTGHGGASHLTFCLAVCGTVALIALAACLVARVRPSGSLGAPLWVFALLPPLGFTVQEHLERLLHPGALAHATALEPTFGVGLLLQVPFALAAYVVARGLLTLALAVAKRLRAPLRPRLLSLEVRLPARIPVRALRMSTLASGSGPRAPPPLPL